nr:hypothetical protein [Halovivax sp. TS33]
MSDRDAEFASDVWRLSAVRVALLSIMVVLLSALLVALVSSESGQAAATVGFVLAEALVLYVGYGALMRIASPSARELLVRS